MDRTSKGCVTLLTTMNQIKIRLDQVERGIFEHSLFPKPRDELLDLRQEALDLKEDFLNSPFIVARSMEELEDIRYKIVECVLTAHILSSEAMYQDTSGYMQRLIEHLESEGGGNDGAGA